jgi:hypothetical protein
MELAPSWAEPPASCGEAFSSKLNKYNTGNLKHSRSRASKALCGAGAMVSSGRGPASDSAHQKWSEQNRSIGGVLYQALAMVIVQSLLLSQVQAVSFTAGDYSLDKTVGADYEANDGSAASTPDVRTANSANLGLFTRNVDQDYFCAFSTTGSCTSCPRWPSGGTKNFVTIDL